MVAAFVAHEFSWVGVSVLVYPTVVRPLNLANVATTPSKRESFCCGMLLRTSIASLGKRRPVAIFENEGDQAVNSNRTFSLSFLGSLEAILKRDSVAGNNALGRADFSQTAGIVDGVCAPITSGFDGAVCSWL